MRAWLNARRPFWVVFPTQRLAALIIALSVLWLALLVPAVLLVVLVAPLGGIATGLAVAVAVTWFVAVSAVVATLTGIFQTAMLERRSALSGLSPMSPIHSVLRSGDRARSSVSRGPLPL